MEMTEHELTPLLLISLYMARSIIEEIVLHNDNGTLLYTHLHFK